MNQAVNNTANAVQNPKPSKINTWILLVLALVAAGLVFFLAPVFLNSSKKESVTMSMQTSSDIKAQDPNVAVKNTNADTVHVKMETSLGVVKMELDRKNAPVTVENFLKYVSNNHYNKTIFHRVIGGFMVQGGGFDQNMQEKRTDKPIINEAHNGLKNERGTLAMARTNDPHSATSQFFINLVDNGFLNPSAGNHGYAVFGKVTEGIDIVDKMAKVKTTQVGPHSDVPEKPIVIESVTIED